MEEDSDRCPACDQPLEEEYIDMDLTSTTFSSYPINDPPESREFEFRISSNLDDQREPISSLADELFYKGNLLPLHLPPRLQMVERLLHNPTTTTTTSNEKARDHPPEANITTAAHNTNSIRPSESFNISPESAPCSISSCSAVLHQLKEMTQSSQCLRLRAPREYLKSLFITRPLKSLFICSGGAGTVRKAEESSSAEERRRNPFGQERRERDEVSETTTGRTGGDRRTGEDRAHGLSFLGVMKHRLVDYSSSPSSASLWSSSSSTTNENSSDCCELPALKRSSSVSSEVESFIQSAIVYCKKSLQTDCTRIGL